MSAKLMVSLRGPVRREWSVLLAGDLFDSASEISDGLREVSGPVVLGIVDGVVCSALGATGVCDGGAVGHEDVPPAVDGQVRDTPDAVTKTVRGTADTEPSCGGVGRRAGSSSPGSPARPDFLKQVHDSGVHIEELGHSLVEFTKNSSVTSRGTLPRSASEATGAPECAGTPASAAGPAADPNPYGSGPDAETR